MMRALLLAGMLVALAVPVHAAPRDEAVQVRAGDAVLAGTLTFPEQKPRAAAVLIQGAGPHARDQVISGTPMFKQVADDLAARGIATVRVDNSGVGESTGAKVAHFQQRVPQLRAVFDFLAARPELAGVPVGLIGHSEGTMVATEIWRDRGGPIDFLVLVGAPGRQGRVVWVDQQSNPERFPGKDAAALAEVRATFERVADASIAGDRTGLTKAADHLFAISGLSAEEIAEVRPGFIARMASDEMRVFLAADPATAFERVTDPVLALWGTHDELADPALNVPAFLEHRNPAGELTVMVLPNQDHFFLVGEGLPPGEHKKGQMRLSPVLGQTIAHYISTIGDRGPGK